MLNLNPVLLVDEPETSNIAECRVCGESFVDSSLNEYEQCKKCARKIEEQYK